MKLIFLYYNDTFNYTNCMDYKDITGYKTELCYFLKHYACGLVGSSQEEIDEERIEYSTNKDVFYNQNGYFCVPVLSEKSVFFKVHALNDSQEINLRILRYLFISFNRISKYFYDSKLSNQRKSKIKIDYPSKYSHINQFEYATQMAISKWIASNDDAVIYGGVSNEEAISNRIESLLKMLDNWSKKTYEGKNVSFSFVINPELKPIDDETFLSFLDEEYSATLTDCITSAFEIDLNCSLRNYLSIITPSNFIEGYELRNGLPIRFSNIIEKLIVKKKIGVFLLSNGDIIIAQNQRIIFVKRCGKWLNFSKEIFEFALEKFCKNKILISEIFSTIMDISFSHSGGIIAYLETEALYHDDNKTIDTFDLLFRDKKPEELKKYLINRGVSPSVAQKEVEKRNAKKKIIKKILGIEGGVLPNFAEVERKLRSDLSALDGALILNQEGLIIAAGTIIKADKGSSGGGRSTAAKTLSDDGFAIKVSTDGYIEVYAHRNLIYAIK